MREKTSKFNIVLVLILLINISILYLFYQNKENRLLVKDYLNEFFDKKQENVVKIEKEIEIKNQVVIDTNDWKTYEDNLYDFKIKYPNYWSDPQVQVIDNENSAFQYQVRFGVYDDLNEKENNGFLVFVSKKNITDKKANVCSSDQNNLSQTNYQEFTFLYPFSKLKVADDYAFYHSCQFMGQNFEYKIVPILDENPISLLRNKKLREFESAKNTFIIDFETIQKKITEQERQEKARRLAIQKARQAQAEAQRIARLRSCAHPERKPSYSDTKGKHKDEDCCPDPDEWPDPKCRYSASDYAIMLKR